MHPPALAGISSEITTVVDRSLPALVRIHTERRVFKPVGNYFRGLLGSLQGIVDPFPPYRLLAFPLYLLFGYLDLGQGMGSGFFVGEDLVLTNAHVVENSSRVECQLVDGRRASARLELYDDVRDLALLRILTLEGSPPPPLRWRRHATRLGEPVLAMGFPTREVLRDPVFQFPLVSQGRMSPNPTVTAGIVSGINVHLGNFQTTYVETDAALNPGSSGGPLLALDGTVVGVVTYTGVGKENEGYAIPAETALNLLTERLRADGAGR